MTEDPKDPEEQEDETKPAAGESETIEENNADEAATQEEEPAAGEAEAQEEETVEDEAETKTPKDILDEIAEEEEKEQEEEEEEQSEEQEEEEEEEEEEPEEQEEAAMPEGTQSCRTAGGIFVTATFGENVFPEGVMMQATDLSKEEAMDAAAGAVEGEVVDAAGADITFYDAAGDEVEPYEGGEVQVSLTLDTPLEDGELAVVHIDDAGNAEELAGSDVDEATENGASFTATEFSIYVEASFTKDDSSGNSVANVEYDYEGHKITFDLVLDGSATIIYDGTPKKPSVQNLALDGRTEAGGVSVKATDVSYENNTDAGKATIIFAVTTGKLKWYYVHANFTIEQLDLNDAKVDVSNCIYDGTEQEPEVTVTYNGKHISADNYNVEYTNSKNLGEGSTTITGKNNCTGTVTKTFSISKVDLYKCSMSLGQYTYYMDENPKEPSVTVTYGNETLKKDEDYTVEYRGNDEIGTADVVIRATESSNYKGSCVMRYYIKARPIKTATISFDRGSSVTYDGSAQKPDVTVTMEIDGATKTLDAKTDYTVTYSNNVDVGTATVTVKGSSNYSGEVSETFAITPKDISSGLTITEGGGDIIYYDGSEKTKTITVEDGSKTLKEGTDYKITYDNNIDVGTATGTITGLGNYTGTALSKISFEIKPAYISNSEVKLKPYTDVYTGEAIVPEIESVTYPGVKNNLIKDTDYTIKEYVNNNKAGVATVIIEGKGNYQGTKEVQFGINSLDLTDTNVTLNPNTFEYDGYEKEPSVTVEYKGKILDKNTTEYDEVIGNNTNAGIATVTITGKNSFSESITKTFTITRKSITGAIVTLSEKGDSDTSVPVTSDTYTYDGTEKKPTVTVNVDDVKNQPVEDTDYTVSYSNNINAGTATVTVTGKGNYTGTVKKTFTINQADLEEYSWVLCGSYPDDLTWSKIIDNIIDIIFGNVENEGERTVSYTYTYDGTAKKPEATVFYASTQAGVYENSGDRKKLVRGTDYTVSYDNNVDIGNATLTVVGTGNYTGKVSTTFTIEGKDLGSTTLSLPEDYSYTFDGTKKRPTVTVKDGDTTLTEGKDFETEYFNNTDVGTAGVVITAAKGSSYEFGNLTHFTIEPLKLSGSAAKIELEKTEYTRDYTKKKPAVTVTYNGKTIDSDNYKVTYENNIYGPDAKAIVTGTSANCIGTRELSFTIYDSDISNADITVSPDTYTYDGKAKEPEVTVTLAGKILKANDDYTVEYSENVDVGEASVIVTGVGEYEGTKEATFTITEKAVESSGTTNSSPTSSGSSSRSSVVTSSGGGFGSSGSSSSDSGYTAGSKGSKASYNTTGKKSVTYDECKVGNKKKTAKVPSKVKIGKKTYKVTAVSSYAFVFKSNLESVTIGNNVKKIGVSAFSGCDKLKTITIKSRRLTAKGVKNCLKGSSVETIIVPDGTEKAYAKIFAKENSGRGKAVKIIPASKAAKKK